MFMYYKGQSVNFSMFVICALRTTITNNKFTTETVNPLKYLEGNYYTYMYKT